MNDFIFLEYDIKYSQETIDLWNEEIGFIYPISPKMFNQNINNKYLLSYYYYITPVGSCNKSVCSSNIIYFTPYYRFMAKYSECKTGLLHP